MKQSTFSAVMANSIKNLLQGYTKGIRFTAILTILFTIGVGSMLGDTYSLTPNASQTGSNSTQYITTLYSFTYNDVSWKMNQWNPSTLQIKTNQSSATSEWRFYNTSAFPGKITKVVITFSAMTVSDASKLMFKGGTSEVTATSGGTAGTWNSSAKTLTWTPGASDNFTYFAFYQNGKAASGTNKLATSNAIVVTYETTASCDKQVTVTKGNTTGGNFTIRHGSASGTEVSSESSIDNCTDNVVLVVIPYADEHHSCTGVTATNGTVSGPINGNYTITYTKDKTITSTISATFEKDDQYTVNWYVNGTKEYFQTSFAGTELTDIPNLENYDCNGKKFVGWTTISDYVDETDAPYDLIANTAGMTIPEGGEDYYAVFANSKTTNDGSSTKEYSFTITKDDFTTTSYADNNKSKKSTATATDGSGATFNVTWKSNQVYQNSGMQWQKGTGYIYNETNLGSISSVIVQSTAGTFKTFYGDAECPSSGTTSGKPFFKTYETNVATGKTSEIIITFTQTTTGEEVTTFSNYSTTCIPPEEYTIKWMVNGELYAETTVIEGNTLAPPTINEIPTACGGRVFRGWTESETVDTDGLGINYVDESTIPDEDKTYYAVFAKAQGSSNGDYVKVESTLPDWSGEYLIVYEKESKAFNGSLTALDASNNTINVEISNNSIKSNPTNDAAIFTIVKMNESGGYSLKSKSGYYIGYTSNDKGLDSHQTTQYLNTIAFGKGWDSQETESVVIRSQNGQMLLYNSAADRFRYYGSAQGYIALYCKSTFTDYTTVCIETYEVSFDMNGHGEDQKPNAQIVEKDQKAEAPTINDITGYKFGGWYIEPACTTAYDFNTPITADITLYAKWTATCITITWNPNYSATSTTSTYTYDGATIELPIPVRTGYTFVGWFTEPSGGTQIIEVGTTNKPTSDVEYFAHWEANTYQVVFNANTGEGGAMDNQLFTYDVEQKLTANTYTKFGHTFAGWATTADGEKVYDDRHSVSNLTATDKAIVTLYAVWTELPKFTVTWRVNGEETLEQVYQGYKVANPPAIATPPCGDIFVGWTIENYKGDAAPTPLYRTLDEIPAIEGDKTFYAVFADYAD